MYTIMVPAFFPPGTNGKVDLLAIQCRALVSELEDTQSGVTTSDHGATIYNYSVSNEELVMLKLKYGAGFVFVTVEEQA